MKREMADSKQYFNFKIFIQEKVTPIISHERNVCIKSSPLITSLINLAMIPEV